MNTNTLNNGNSSNIDLMDAAFNPEPIVLRQYVQVSCDVWPGMLVKGVGKQPYDPAGANGRAPLTIIEIHLSPAAGNAQYGSDHDFILQFNDGWRKVVLPSLQALGLNSLHDINGKYAVVELVEAGWFKGRDDERVIIKAPKFIAIFDTVDELTAAWVADRDGSASSSNTPSSYSNGSNGTAAAAAPSAPVNDKQYDVALALLPSLVGLAKVNDGFDLARVGELLSKNALTARYFNANSPEVVAAMQAAMNEAAF